MYVDANLVLSGSAVGNTVTYQTVTGATAVLSTNTVDLSQARDIGEGNDLVKVRFQVGTVFAGLTALTVDVISTTDAALTAGIVVIGSSGPIPVAQLIAGARFAIELNPRLNSIGQRYLGLRFTPTGTGTTGTVFADLGPDYQDGATFYPTGFAVL